MVSSLFNIYRPKRSFGQGNIFTPVCHSVHRGGGACSKFLGGCLLQIFGGGACSKFSGGCLLQISGGWGCLLQIFGGVPAPNFWGGPPIFGIRSPFGRYASYWNAFLLMLICLQRFEGNESNLPEMTQK